MGLLCFLLRQCRKWHREQWRLWLRFNTSLHSTCWPTMAVISPPPVSTWTQCTANSVHFLSSEQMKVLAMTPTSCITVGMFLRMATGLFQVSLCLFRVCFWREGTGWFSPQSSDCTRHFWNKAHSLHNLIMSLRPLALTLLFWVPGELGAQSGYLPLTMN